MRERTIQFKESNLQGLGSPYPLWIFDRRATPQPRQRYPEGCFLAGTWRRCSSVTERCGYAPSSRLASRPPENSAPIPHFDMGS